MFWTDCTQNYQNLSLKTTKVQLFHCNWFAIIISRIHYNETSEDAMVLLLIIGERKVGLASSEPTATSTPFMGSLL
jgi:hypothetical protein